MYIYIVNQYIITRSTTLRYMYIDRKSINSTENLW